jgi:Ca2+-dependent lipid-binding protein
MADRSTAYNWRVGQLYSTRVITRDLNPVWEQTAYLLVSADEVRAQEKLSVQLWDSDDISADDLVG